MKNLVREERFDVVDEWDIPTGQTVTKQEAHANGALHRLAAVFVFDQQGKLYIQEHKKLGLLDHSVGGHVMAGEDYQLGAVREAAEELGLLNVSLGEISTSFKSMQMDPGSTINHIFGIYECYPSKAWKFIPNEEVDSIYPESLEKIVAHMHQDPGAFTSGFISTMGEYLRVKKLPLTLDLERCRQNWRRPEKQY